MNLAQINTWTDDQARESFRRCCASTRWSREMTRLRPFNSSSALLEAAEAVWWGLSAEDWLEAFAAHPRIGDKDALAAKFAATAAWSAREQAGIEGSPAERLGELAEENDRYFERFGYLFIVCATGKTADEMLASLRTRLSNEPAVEIQVAAAEQAKITRIRLERFAP